MILAVQVALALPAGTAAVSPAGVRMVWIPPTPARGVDLGDPGHPHIVHLDEGLWMMDAEVDQALYRRIGGPPPATLDPAAFRPGQAAVGDTLPQVGANLAEIAVFANRLSEADGLTPRWPGATPDAPPDRWDPDATGWRLPDLWEWRWAASAGQPRAWPTAFASEVCAHANVADATLLASERVCDLRDTRAEVAASLVPFAAFPCIDGFPALAPVRSLRPNAWGLYDTLGNAAEWVVVPAPPRGPRGHPVRRPRDGPALEAAGGDWVLPRTSLWYRDGVQETQGEAREGFRLVRPASPPP